ncbi:MAG: hypothetical protein CSA35_07670 [Dethiosulfovibrio peptidovorans]|nr:MAG: hypothetical protein CSA35_07670 [Dethiosulfovibrio peptidovorans]
MWDVSSYLASETFRRQLKSLATGINERIGPVRLMGSWDRDTYGLVYEDFKDRTHLSLSGAEKFTTTVFSCLDEIARQQPIRMTEKPTLR